MVHDRFTVDVGDVETLKSVHRQPPPGGVGLRRVPGDAGQLIRDRRRARGSGCPPGQLLPSRADGMARSRGALRGHPRPLRRRRARATWRSARGAIIRRLEQRLADRGEASVEAPLQRIAELQAREAVSSGRPAHTAPAAHRPASSALARHRPGAGDRRASGTCSSATTAAAPRRATRRPPPPRRQPDHREPAEAGQPDDRPRRGRVRQQVRSTRSRCSTRAACPGRRATSPPRSSRVTAGTSASSRTSPTTTPAARSRS